MKTAKLTKNDFVIIICILIMFGCVVYVVYDRIKILNEFNSFISSQNNSIKMCQLYDYNKMVNKTIPRGIYYPSDDVMCAYIGDSPNFYYHMDTLMHEYCHHLILNIDITHFCEE